MKKRKSTTKQKIIKFIAMSLLAQFIILVGTDLVSQNLSNKIILHYSQITTIDPSTIKSAISTITDPIRNSIEEIKNQLLTKN